MIDAATIAVVAICMTVMSFFTQAKQVDTTPGEKVETVQCTGCPATTDAAVAAPVAAAAPAATEATAVAMPAPVPAPAEVTPIAPMAQVMEKPAPMQVAAATEPAKEDSKKSSKAAKGKHAAPAAAAASEPASMPAPASAAAADAAHGFHINVGLFAVPMNAHNAYQKLTGAGLAAYTQEITSKTKGKLTRVRVGPFDTRAEADAAADKIHGLQLEAVVFQR